MYQDARGINLIIQFQCGAVFSGFRELPLLHAFAHIPGEVGQVLDSKSRLD
jgi:hypothetical protein